REPAHNDLLPNIAVWAFRSSKFKVQGSRFDGARTAESARTNLSESREGSWPVHRNAVGLKIEAEADAQGAMAWQLGRQVERIQPIVLIGNIQQGKGGLGVTLIKAITDEGVELPEIIARKARRVTAIRLLRPEGLRASEETRRMIQQRE